VPVKRVALLVLVALGVAGLSALGVWQIERRAWKLALIERVEQRVHAPAVPAPAPADWPGVSREKSEYLHVVVRGHFIGERQVLTQAVTDLGAGYWVLAPFQAEDGFVVLVNRGFVPSAPATSMTHDDSPAQQVPATEVAEGGKSAGVAESADTVAQPPGEPISITGLLRITEPQGGFLRKNDPSRNQWYSRDVQAISQALGLTDTAPYFIDADDAEGASQQTPHPRKASEPVPGLTVISFHNSHLVYAITWFSLALMVAALGFRMARYR
jgi:surfeit locus 1 family protein